MTAAVAAAPSPGPGLLVRLATRRDRVMVPVWLAVLLLVDFASAASVPGLYLDRGRTGEGRGGDQRESRHRRALRPDPRRAQHRRARDDEDDGAVRRVRRDHGALRRAQAHASRRGERPGGADRRGTAITSDAPLTAAVAFGAGRGAPARPARRSRQHRRRTPVRRFLGVRGFVGRRRSGRRSASRPSPARSRRARGPARRSPRPRSGPCSCSAPWGTPPRPPG